MFPQGSLEEKRIAYCCIPEVLLPTSGLKSFADPIQTPHGISPFAIMAASALLASWLDWWDLVEPGALAIAGELLLDEFEEASVERCFYC